LETQRKQIDAMGTDRRGKRCQVYNDDAGKKGRHYGSEKGLGYRRWKQFVRHVNRQR